MRPLHNRSVKTLYMHYLETNCRARSSQLRMRLIRLCTVCGMILMVMSAIFGCMVLIVLQDLVYPCDDYYIQRV